MNAIGLYRKCHICSRVDQQTRPSTGSVRSDDAQALQRKSFQLAASQVFLAQLDQMHSTAGRLRNFCEQGTPPYRFASVKLTAVGDVAEEQERFEWSTGRRANPSLRIRLGDLWRGFARVFGL